MDTDRYAFDLLDRLRGDGRPEHVRTELEQATRFFGLNSFLATAIPRLDCSLSAGVHCSWFPQGWLARYLERGYDRIDIALQKARETTRPFRTLDLRKEGLQPLQQQVFDEAAEFGVNGGFVIPLHDRNGLVGIVFFGASNYELSARDETALHLIAIYAYEALRNNGACVPPQFARRPLTARELECVKWSADGKTSREIGVILKISDQTVTEHLSSACQKLNAHSRPQLIAKCMRAGLFT